MSTHYRQKAGKQKGTSKSRIGHFRAFRVFWENSEIFSRLLNLKGFVLFEKVGNFRGFRVFDFGPYTEIENSENPSRLLNLNGFLLFEKNWEFLRFSSFRFWPLCWNQKLGKLGNIYNTCKFQGMCFTWGSCKLPRFPSFRFWPLYWNRKLGKLGNFVLSESVLFEEVKKGVLKKFYKFHWKTPGLENTRKTQKQKKSF